MSDNGTLQCLVHTANRGVPPPPLTNETVYNHVSQWDYSHSQLYLCKSHV